MMHASATPPPSPKLAHLTRSRAACRGNIARAADPPTPRRACQQWCLWWMQYTSRTIPAKPGRRCLEAYLPAATTACQRPRAHGAHVAARGRINFHPRAQLARPRGVSSSHQVWPIGALQRVHQGFGQQETLLGFVGACRDPAVGPLFFVQSVVRSRTGLSKFAEPYVQEHRP